MKGLEVATKTAKKTVEKKAVAAKSPKGNSKPKKEAKVAPVPIVQNGEYTPHGLTRKPVSEASKAKMRASALKRWAKVREEESANA